MEDERRALAARMTDKAAKLLQDMPLRQMRRLEEMRFYAGQNACFVFDGRGETQNVFFSQRDVDELVTALCGHSRYAYETQLAQGYIPLGNGCRAGVCGRVTTGESGRLSSPTSVCIRVARDVPGASGGVLPYIMGEGGRVCRALLLGPPGCGKTTVLRDAAKKLAAMGIRVAVCDEREELFPTGEVEQGIDVMRGSIRRRPWRCFCARWRRRRFSATKSGTSGTRRRSKTPPDAGSACWPARTPEHGRTFCAGRF